MTSSICDLTWAQCSKDSEDWKHLKCIKKQLNEEHIKSKKLREKGTSKKQQQKKLAWMRNWVQGRFGEDRVSKKSM